MNRLGTSLGSLIGAMLNVAPMRYDYRDSMFGISQRKPVDRGGYGGTVYHPNGAREVARRTRQVAAGSLKYENGYRPA